MNLYEFYYSTSMLLVRLGYAIDLDQLDLKSGNDKAAKINKWYERITAGLDFFFDIEMPSRKPVHIPLDKFSEEKLEALKSNWQSLTRDLPLAGLRYSHGKPIVFGARVIHQVNESAIKDLFERLHDEFVEFSSNYEIAFSESGYNICDLCFAFSSNDDFEEARSLVRKNKGGFWKGTYTIGWLFNLETLELLTTNGFTPAHINVLEMTALFLARNKGAQSLDAWKAPNGTITGGALGPKTFLQFMHFFAELSEQGKIKLPAEFIKRIKETEAKGT